MTDANAKGKALFVGADIFLGTMVAQAAQKGGFSCQSALPSKVYATVAEDPSIRAIVADLKEAKEFLKDIVDSASVGGHPVLIAITFHTDLESKRQAQEAGFEYILHRSQISSLLPQILSEKRF